MRLLSLFLLVLLSGNLVAFPEFTYNQLGSRASGMGGAYVGVAQYSESVFYNWAAPPVVEDTNIKLDHGRILETPYYTFSAENIPYFPWLRVGYLYYSVNDIPRTEINDKLQPEVSGDAFSNDAHSVYLSTRVPTRFMDFGFRFNSFFEQLYSESASSMSLDLALYKAFELFDLPMTFGATWKNAVYSDVVWSTGHQDELYPIYNIGGSIKLFDEQLLLAGELQQDIDPLQVYLGAEHWVNGSEDDISALALRAGFMDRDFSLGIGLHLDGYILDYSVIQPHATYEELGYRFGITKRFYDKSQYKESVLDFQHEIEEAPKVESIYKIDKEDPSTLLSASLEWFIAERKLSYKIEDDIVFLKRQGRGEVPLNVREKTAFPVAFRGEIGQDDSLRISFNVDGDELVMIGYVPSYCNVMMNGAVIKPDSSGRLEKRFSGILEDVDRFSLLVYKR